MKYKVGVTEQTTLYYKTVEIEADSWDEAADKATQQALDNKLTADTKQSRFICADIKN